MRSAQFSPDDIDWENAFEQFHPALAAPATTSADPRVTFGVQDMLDIWQFIQRWAPAAVSVFTSAVFMDSLRYKFTNAPQTQEIFGRLEAWGTSLGAPGLFARTGLFSQYVIGAAELAASLLLLAGLFLTPFRFLQPLGALIGLAVMTGAIGFHLFTPLGVDPNNDGGGLFRAAVGVWIGCVVLLIMRRDELVVLVHKAAAFLAPVAG